MKLKNVLLGVGLLLPALASAQPMVINTEAAGFLERGKLMYETHNYAGAIDQLSHVGELPCTAAEQEQADFYMALSHFERGEESSIDALLDFIEANPSSLLVQQAQLKVGNYYFYRGDWENALSSYSLVREGALDGDANEDVLYRRAYCRLRLGEYDAARPLYARLSNTRRYAEAAQFYDAYIDYADGRYDDAMEIFQAINPEGELGYQSQYYVTQINYHKQQFADVIKQGRALLDEHANDYFDAELNRLLGESYYHTGNKTMARKYLRDYLDNPEGEPYRTAGYTMGVLDYEDGQYERAVNELSLALNQSDALAQSAYLYTGQCRIKLGDLNGAARAFEQAAGMDFDKGVKETAFYNYAVSQNQGARTPFDKSIDMLEQFLNDYPKSKHRDTVEGYLVDAYTGTTDYQRALTSINHIKNPSAKVQRAKQIVLYNLGIQSLNNNQNNDAVNYLKQAVALGQQDKAVLNESRLWLAEAQYRLGDYKQAAANQQAYVKAASKSDDNYALAQYNLGYSLYQQRQYTQARTAFENAVAAKGLSADLLADAYNRIGDTQYYAADYTAAQASYDRALQADKGGARDYAMFQKAMMAAHARQYDAAVTSFDELLKAYPNSQYAPQAMLEKATALLATGKNDQALKAYQAVTAAYPKSVEARKALLQTAIVNKELERTDAALQAYREVIKKYPSSDEAVAAAEDMKRIHADNGTLAEFQSFLKSVPGAPALDVNEVDRLTFEAAEKAAIATKPSIAKMEQYLQQNPKGAYRDRALYYIARHHYAKGDYNQAIANLDEALKMSPDASFAEDALAMRSDILLRQGKSAEALKSYKDLVERSSSDDNRLVARMGLMRAAKAANQWSELQQVADALVQQGGLTAAEEKEVTMNRAIAASHLGKSEQAMADLKKLAADPQSEVGAQAAVELATMQFEAGNYKQAERTLNNFIDAGTPHSYYLAKGFLLLSDIYAKQGKTADAIDYLQSLRTNYPGKEKEIFDAIDSRLKSLGKGKANAGKSAASSDNSKKSGKKK
ncbi:MAG: tetratricopeptide repeat protein [Muribaculaceae bacterium]|nr:tetratricopeptide repeat protein [Muribaculaceae bacterium]